MEKRAFSRRRRREELIEHLKHVRDEEGYAVVNVSAADESVLFSSVAADETRDLSGEIYGYIDERTDVIPDVVPLKVRFRDASPDLDREAVRAAMHSHYMLRALDVSKKIAGNLAKMLFLALFGAAVLIVYFCLTVTSKNLLFTEILSIVGTFSLWEAANAFLLERPGLKRELRHVTRHLDQVVEFVERGEKEEKKEK